VSQLLKKLLASLFPGVGEVDEPEDNPDAPEDAPEELDDDLPELPEDDEPAPARSRARNDNSEALKAANERAQRLEDDVATLKRGAQSPSEEQRLRADEDRALQDPNTDAMTKWQIQANRTLRETQQEARTARNQAADMMDKATFMSKAAEDPRRAKYGERIEKELSSLRAKGQNVDRETLYYYQLGKDIAEGKLKAAPKAKAKVADVPRGRTPAARSDVRSGGNGKSASGARERLSNMNI
jgi:hypothetical protein